MKKTIFLTLMALFVFMSTIQAQQTHKVSGKVVDQKSGEELIGVTVMIKGSSRGVITDVNGNYSLEVTNGATDVLTFSYIGYDSLQETVKNRRNWGKL